MPRSPYLSVRWAALSLAVVVAGCASTSGRAPSSASPDLLVAEDLEAWAAEDLLSAIQRLRPRWLTAPLAVGMSGPTPRSVVVDDVRQPGSLENLRGYVAGNVAEARFVNARDATTRYGLNMMSGAIVVRLKR